MTNAIITAARHIDRKPGTYVVSVTGLEATCIKARTVIEGNQVVVVSASASTGPGSKFFTTFTAEKNGDLFNAIADFINA